MPKSASPEPPLPARPESSPGAPGTKGGKGLARSPAPKPGGDFFPDAPRRPPAAKAPAGSRMGSDSGRQPPGSPSSEAGADREARRIPGLVERPLVKGEEHDAHTRSVMRTRLLGEDTELNAVDQARREARLLGQMEHQGEAPTRIVSQLNEQLSGAQGPEFKRMLA